LPKKGRSCRYAKERNEAARADGKRIIDLDSWPAAVLFSISAADVRVREDRNAASIFEIQFTRVARPINAARKNHMR
jgi:hypothetical protein